MYNNVCINVTDSSKVVYDSLGRKLVIKSEGVETTAGAGVAQVTAIDQEEPHHMVLCSVLLYIIRLPLWYVV